MINDNVRNAIILNEAPFACDMVAEKKNYEKVKQTNRIIQFKPWSLSHEGMFIIWHRAWEWNNAMQ